MSLSLETMTTSKPACSARARDGADDVVGLEAGVLQDGDAHGFEDTADVRDLLAQIGRHFGAIGLVLGELVLALGPGAPLSKTAAMYSGA